MKNVVDDEMLDYVGILSQLEIKENEREKIRHDMNEMLDYVDKLNELDTNGVEPVTHLFDTGNVFREDEVTNGNGQEDTLANAPERHEDYLVVPKTI